MKMTYGFVTYVNWQSVLMTLGNVAKVLELPDSAFVALDKARGHAKPAETAKEVNVYIEKNIPDFVDKVKETVEKAKLAIAKAKTPSTLSAVVAETMLAEELTGATAEGPLLSIPVKTAEVRTVDGIVRIPVDDVAKEDSLMVCKSCDHSITKFHKFGTGCCTFAVGTYAACLCRKAV